jgi:hypothetical protein
MATPYAMDIPKPSNRKVWVINNWTDDYTEEFQGVKITVPKNGKKELLMPVIEASVFLGQGKPPAVFAPDGKTLTPGSFPPKMLKTVELTPEEIEKLDGGVEARVTKFKEDEAKAKGTCSICGSEFTEKGLKLHVQRIHPEYELQKDA